MERAVSGASLRSAFKNSKRRMFHQAYRQLTSRRVYLRTEQNYEHGRMSRWWQVEHGSQHSDGVAVLLPTLEAVNGDKTFPLMLHGRVVQDFNPFKIADRESFTPMKVST